MHPPTSLSPVCRSPSTNLPTINLPTTTPADHRTMPVALPIPTRPPTTVQAATRSNTQGAYKDFQWSETPMIRTRRLSTRAPHLTLNKPISKLNLGCHKPFQWPPVRPSLYNNLLSSPHVIGATASTDLEAGTVGIVTDHTATQCTLPTNRNLIPVLTTAYRGIGCFFY